MPESWKTIPINAGLLAALATGVAATLLAGYSLQSWIDARIDDQVNRQLIPIEQELNQVTTRLDYQTSTRVRNQQRILERLEGLDDRLTEEERH